MDLLAVSGDTVMLLALLDRKSTRLNSSHRCNSYAVFCSKNKTIPQRHTEPAHRARDAALSSRATAIGSRCVRAGQVDTQPPDAQLPRPMRSLQHLLPGTY